MLKGRDKVVINAIIFDLYGTLIDIRTDEKDSSTYWILSRYLSYHGINIESEDLKNQYFEGINKSLNNSDEPHPEVNVFDIFSQIMHRYGRRIYNEQCVSDICMLFRSLTIRHFQLFPEVVETLSYLQSRYLLGLISDAQWVFTEPELEIVNLDRFFKKRVLSSRYGYKKPDKRLFKTMLKKLDIKPDEAVYIGDNAQRDLVGAKQSGMRCILFRNESPFYNGYTADAIFYNYNEIVGVLNKLQ
ncbi:MAG: HAD family hydrolase [Thermodesulfovibrionales bacterium]|nr:HAD family hydrolase [Thermodesulfovibrionales bacterium]